MFLFLLNSQKEKQAQLGLPHSRIQVELGFILQAGTYQILNSPYLESKTDPSVAKTQNYIGDILY